MVLRLLQLGSQQDSDPLQQLVILGYVDSSAEIPASCKEEHTLRIHSSYLENGFLFEKKLRQLIKTCGYIEGERACLHLCFTHSYEQFSADI